MCDMVNHQYCHHKKLAWWFLRSFRKKKVDEKMRLSHSTKICTLLIVQPVFWGLEVQKMKNIYTSPGFESEQKFPKIHHCEFQWRNDIKDIYYPYCTLWKGKWNTTLYKDIWQHIKIFSGLDLPEKMHQYIWGSLFIS